MARLFRRIRTAGQDVPPCNIQTLEVLKWGGCLIAWPTPFPMDQAGAAWEAHRHAVLEAWRAYWQPHGVLPVCWAERKFDGAPQIETTGFDKWTRDRIHSIGPD